MCRVHRRPAGQRRDASDTNSGSSAARSAEIATGSLQARPAPAAAGQPASRRPSWSHRSTAAGHRRPHRGRCAARARTRATRAADTRASAPAPRSVAACAWQYACSRGDSSTVNCGLSAPSIRRPTTSTSANGFDLSPAASRRSRPSPSRPPARSDACPPHAAHWPGDGPPGRSAPCRRVPRRARPPTGSPGPSPARASSPSDLRRSRSSTPRGSCRVTCHQPARPCCATRSRYLRCAGLLK